MYSVKIVYITYHERMHADNVISKRWLVRSSLSQQYSGVLANIAFKNVTQVHTRAGKSWSFICKVNLSFLPSMKRFDCNGGFRLIASLLTERVYSFHTIGNLLVDTGFQVIIFWRVWKFYDRKPKFFLSNIFYTNWQDHSYVATSLCPSIFRYSGKKLLEELIGLSGKSFADVLEANSIVSKSSDEWL